MNRSTQLLITLMVALPVLALLALRPTAAQAAGWSGWARCEISTRGPGYEQTDTHTWFVTDAVGNTPATSGSGSWQVTGKGNLSQGDPSQTAMRAEWAINGASTAASGARFGVVPLTGGLVSIRPFHSQLRMSGAVVGYVQQTINHSARTPTPISATAWEWQFPAVQGPATGQTITGTSSANHPGIGWGHMQVSYSTVASSCTWLFANGSTPAPPPTIPPATIPRPRTAPEYPWTGSAQCRVTVTSGRAYKDLQVHTWTFTGGAPKANGSVYVHPVIWSVEGNGTYEQTQGINQLSANWTTRAEGRAPFALSLRASDGKLILNHWQALRRVPGGVTGSEQQTVGAVAQKPVPINLEAVEWALPVIESDPNRTIIQGSIKATHSPLVAAPVSPLQPPNASILSDCSWQLQRGP